MKQGLDERGYISRKKIWRWVGLIGLYVFAALAVLVGSRFVLKPAPVNQGPVYGNLDDRFESLLTLERDGKKYQYYKNYLTNVLVIGVDQENLNTETRQRSGGQADFLLLLSINRATRTITPVHIDRDTITDVKVYGAFGDEAGTREMQICLSHAFGDSEEKSSENTVWAVSNLLRDIPIDHYVTMDMSGIAELNDALGGVTVTLTEDFSALDPAMTEGATLTLRGKQAEYFVRGRHSVGDFSNRQRMDHQRTFIAAAIPMVYERIKKESGFFVSLYDHMQPHLCTNVKTSWLQNNAYALEKYYFMSVQQIKGEHTIGKDGFVEFHVDESALEDLIIDVFLNER